MDFNKAMVPEQDSEDFYTADENENPTEPVRVAPNSSSDLGKVDPPQSTTIRRKRRRRNFAPSNVEYSRTHASPTYAAPMPEHRSGERRRRSRRRSSRRTYAKALRVAVYAAIHVVFIALLIFLWMKISAKINE